MIPLFVVVAILSSSLVVSSTTFFINYHLIHFPNRLHLNDNSSTEEWLLHCISPCLVFFASTSSSSCSSMNDGPDVQQANSSTIPLDSITNGVNKQECNGTVVKCNNEHTR